MATFVDTTVQHIETRLDALATEISRLEAARAALLDGARAAGASDGGRRRAPAGEPSGAARGRRRRGRGARHSRGARSEQALELVRSQPGITIPEIAKAMDIPPNYLYRVLPKLAARGEVKRRGQGWEPSS